MCTTRGGATLYVLLRLLPGYLVLDCRGVRLMRSSIINRLIDRRSINRLIIFGLD